MNISKKISVCMISMNEEKAIHQVVSNIRKYCSDSEIVLVDSSTDNTAEIASDLGVKVIKQYPPKGYGMALDLAINSCSRDCIVTLDCDNTYPAESIMDFAKEIIDNKYDIVDGSRIEKKQPNMPILNYLGNWFFARLASIIFFKNLKDLHSGMRAYRKGFLKDLSINPDGDAFPVEVLLTSILYKKKYKIIPIKYNERIGKIKMNILKSTYWTIKRIFRVRFKKI